MKTKKPLKKYQGDKSGSSVNKKGISRPDAPIYDMSFVNALRRVALDPTSAGNWIESMGPQLMIKPLAQTINAFESVGAKLGNKQAKSNIKDRKEKEAVQRRALQQQLKDKYGFSFKKGGSVKSKPKSKNK